MVRDPGDPPWFTDVVLLPVLTAVVATPAKVETQTGRTLKAPRGTHCGD